MQNNQKISSIPFLLIGFLAGGLLALLHHHQISPELPYLWISLYGLMFLFALPNSKSLIRLCIVTLIPSYLASVPWVWQWNNFYIPFSPFIMIGINTYALTIFHSIYQENGFHFPYPSLFSATWDTFIKLLVGCFFTLICSLILLLWGSLFNLLGIHFFSVLFGKTWFVIWSMAFFYSVGLFVATKTEAMIRNTKMAILLGRVDKLPHQDHRRA